MRSKAKIVFSIVGPLILVLFLLFAIGVLSTPRDFSSPQVVIRLLDENGTPLGGIEVGRNWYDSDIGKDGSDQVMTDRAGIARFPKIPASVGLFTGAWRKAYMSLGMCGAGSGTSTSIYVRYHGLCTDSQSNTMANLSFPRQTKNIDYALSSSVHGK
jgi:hypothetical protein